MILAVPSLAALLVDRLGYGAVGIAIGLESIGLPVPGEATLVALAIYAGVTGQVSIWGVVAAAAAGAIVGDNLGFWIGRTVGCRLLARYGRYVRVTEGRVRLARYLFALHGGKVVFFGRFVAILRALAALLAGTNRMGWGRFLVLNVASGVLWACAYGLGAFTLGSQAHALLGPVGLALSVAAVAATVAAVVFVRRHEARLQIEADMMFADPPAAGRTRSLAAP